MTVRVAKERRMRALAEAIAGCEQAFGEMTEAEMLAQQRRDRAGAIVVRAPRKLPARRRGRRAA